MKSQDTARPAPKRLTLKKETLRRLTPSELRLVAGGLALISNYTCCPRTNAWTGRGTLC